MKKVLIITYYWPPSGGAGVQRWLKFVKYLPKFGWQPIVYTPENPENPVEDTSLFKDIPDNLIVLKTKIWEPYSFYKKLSGYKKGESINAAFLSENKKTSLTEKISVWIRGNFFIPDARKFWIKPSIHYLKKYLQDNPVDAVISSGPPHSMHLIALGLKEQLNINWIADFRDPWTNIDFFGALMLSCKAEKKHKQLEYAVLSNADCLLTIGATMKKEFEALGAKQIEVITNGYDEDDIPKENILLDNKFSLAHIGSLVKSRNPFALWEALSELVTENSAFANDLEIKLVGKVDYSVTETMKEKGLAHFIKKINYLPHSAVVKEQQKSQVLLLLLNDTPNAKGILTGKFFEYMAANRPILCIGPEDGDASEILQETNSGQIFNFKNSIGIKKCILNYYDLFKQKKLITNTLNRNKFSRYFLTEKLSELLVNVSKK